MIDPLLLTVVEEEEAERGYKWVNPMIDILLLYVVKDKVTERGYK